MSLRTFRRMPGFEGVAAGQTATCRLPIGLSYHQVLLNYSGMALSDINEARIVANGEVIFRASGEELDSNNQFEGRAAAAGILIFDFDRYNMRTREAEEFTKLGTGLPAPTTNPPAPGTDPRKVTTLALEIDLSNEATVVGPALSARASQSLPAPSGMTKKTRKFVYNPQGAIDFEISDLPKGDEINKIYFYTAATRLRVERDNFMVFDRTKAENDRFQTDGVRVPQAGMFVYDPTESGNGMEGLETAGVNDLRFTLTVPGAEEMIVIVEYKARLQV